MSFIDYLASLPAVQLDRLYESHWTCQAVLRSLPPLAKQYVLRLLFVDRPIASSELREWVKAEYDSKHRAAVEHLEQLRVLILQDGPLYRLNSPYQKHLREALSTGGAAPRDPAPLNAAGRLPSPAELDIYSLSKWEAVLLQLVSSAQEGGGGGGKGKAVMVDLFVRARLLERRTIGSPQLTEVGFQFLLLDTNSQLWELLREYVAAAEEKGKDSGRIIAFLLELGFHTVGKAYPVSSLSELQQGVVRDLEALGLLMMHQSRTSSSSSSSAARFFIPTTLAANLSASLSESASWQPAEGYIVVETNFRVYAYTASQLQTKILQLFLRVEYQLPNLVVGALSRESANAAFASGISSQQLIGYLRKHAHPQVANRRPVVPENITDQLILWENDRNRVTYAKAVLYDNFSTKEQYEWAISHGGGGILWRDDVKRVFVLREHLHESMRSAIKRQPNR